MKKSVIIISAFILAFTLFFVSCDKNELNPKKDFQDGTALAEKILDFKAEMQSKSNDLMPLEEALENMELLINASHGFPFEEYGELRHDVVNFQLQADENGNVSMAEIAAAYDEMHALVREAYNNSGFDEKGLILVSLSINETDKSGKTIDVSVTTGKSESPGLPIFTDCWYYGEDMGKCDGTHMYDFDGGDTIAYTIAANNPIHDWYDCPGPDYHIILENQDEIWLQGDEPECKSKTGEPLVFVYPDDGSRFTNEEKQLTAEQMNYYYEGEYQVIYTNVPNSEVYGNYTFPAYVLVGCEIEGKRAYVGGIWSLHHKNRLTYARRYWVHNGCIPVPTDIDL